MTLSFWTENVIKFEYSVAVHFLLWKFVYHFKRHGSIGKWKLVFSELYYLWILGLIGIENLTNSSIEPPPLQKLQLIDFGNT